MRYFFTLLLFILNILSGLGARTLTNDFQTFNLTRADNNDLQPSDDFPNPLNDFPNPLDDFPYPLDDFPNPLDNKPIQDAQPIRDAEPIIKP